MFNLHIHRVQQEDRGQYMCQINTDPMMQQVLNNCFETFVFHSMTLFFLSELTASVKLRGLGTGS